VILLSIVSPEYSIIYLFVLSFTDSISKSLSVFICILVSSNMLVISNVLLTAELSTVTSWLILLILLNCVGFLILFTTIESLFWYLIVHVPMISLLLFSKVNVEFRLKVVDDDKSIV